MASIKAHLSDLRRHVNELRQTKKKTRRVEMVQALSADVRILKHKCIIILITTCACVSKTATLVVRHLDFIKTILRKKS